MIQKWIREKYNVELSDDIIESIKNFTLLWNIFENRILERHFTTDKLEGWINGKVLDFEPFTISYEYFKSRYLLERYRFDILFPDTSNDRDRVYSILENQESPNNDKMYALGVIAYRFRNNLFHGNKTMGELPNQNENFIHINEILRQFLDQE